MTVKELLLRMRGTLRIRVKGASTQRFLNLCAKHNIVLWDIERRDWDEIHVTLSVHDFRRLKSHMGRTGCRVHLLARKGAPFAVHRFRKRYVLYGGTLGLAALCFLLMNFVWVIRFHVPEGVSGFEVERNLRELGVYTGARIGGIDSQHVQRELLIRMPEVSFAAINLHGNRIDVEIHRMLPKPEMLDEDAQVSVFAAKAGIITGMEVWNGTGVVKVGDTVEQGDMLVSALMEATNEEQGTARLVHASASVKARTWYEQTSKRATVYEQKQYTGKQKTKYALVFGKNRVNLYLGSGIAQGSCDKIIEEMSVVIADSFALPFRIIRQTERYYETEPIAIPADGVREDMQQKAQALLQARIDGTVSGSTVVQRELAGGAEMTLYAECLEEIAVEAIDTQELPVREQEEGEEPE